MIMTGARAIVECLRERGVDMIFGYPGGMILPMYDALFDEKEIKQIRLNEYNDFIDRVTDDSYFRPLIERVRRSKG